MPSRAPTPLAIDLQHGVGRENRSGLRCGSLDRAPRIRVAAGCSSDHAPVVLVPDVELLVLRLVGREVGPVGQVHILATVELVSTGSPSWRADPASGSLMEIWTQFPPSKRALRSTSLLSLA
jgi:hypothetical protein